MKLKDELNKIRMSALSEKNIREKKFKEKMLDLYTGKIRQHKDIIINMLKTKARTEPDQDFTTFDTEVLIQKIFNDCDFEDQQMYEVISQLFSLDNRILAVPLFKEFYNDGITVLGHESHKEHSGIAFMWGNDYSPEYRQGMHQQLNDSVDLFLDHFEVDEFELKRLESMQKLEL